MLMAEAGFNPREAPKFWNRFSRIKEGQAQPEFFSTHPSDERCASDLVKLMDEAMAVYRPSA